MKFKKQDKAREFLSYLLLAIIAVSFSGNTSSVDKFYINPTERCNIEAAGTVVSGIPKYFVNDDKATRFNRINAKEFVYFVPSEEKMNFSNDKKITTIELKKYSIKESNGEFFIDEQKVGFLKKGDVIILYSDVKVYVYNQDRVSIK